MTAHVIRSDAARLPLPDCSVDLIVTSPPYFGLRSYTDGGEHYAGQVGDEDTPTAYLDRLLECTAEWVRVLKPSGSLFVNLGDKYAGGGGQWDKDDRPDPQRRRAVSGKVSTGGKAWGHKPKSLMLLPQRYAIRCVDELGLIARAEVVWSKPNGLPESVTDRVRRSHEQVWHLTKQPRYYSAVDNIREQYAPGTAGRYAQGYTLSGAAAAGQTANGVLRKDGGGPTATNALGKLPGSVWTIPTAPLKVPASLGVDHFAAYPPDLVRRIILGWSPRDVCTACGEGRRLVVNDLGLVAASWGASNVAGRTTSYDNAQQHGSGGRTLGYQRQRQVVGDRCHCPDNSAVSTPGVVLDPFGGTGTTALVADCYGRTGISVDLSHDYSRLAQWRTTDPGERARVLGVDKPAEQIDGQQDLFGGDAA